MFVSKYAHLDENYNRRDDLISLSYMLVHLTGTQLPWEQLCKESETKENKKETIERIMDMKHNLNLVLNCGRS